MAILALAVFEYLLIPVFLRSIRYRVTVTWQTAIHVSKLKKKKKKSNVLTRAETVLTDNRLIDFPFEPGYKNS